MIISGKNKLVLIVSLLVFVLVYSGVMLAYDEVPMLEDKVAEGELPPMEERIPEEPLVVEAVDGIGQYGGTVRMASVNVEGWGCDFAFFPLAVSMVMPDLYDLSIVNHLAKEVEVDEDARVYTIHMREGVKWSDGQPYTTEDIEFWYNDMLLNEEYTDIIPDAFKAAGEVVELNVIDDYTFELKFAAPQPFFLESSIHQTFHHQPKHYLKDYHPDYTDEDELQARVEEAGYDEWFELMDFVNRGMGGVPLEEGRPTLQPWMIEELSSTRKVYVRNPYFWKVDEEGNQLPYIDKIDTEVVADNEVIQGKIMSGEVDYTSPWGTEFSNYPLYREYEEEGNYRTLLWKDVNGCRQHFMFNMTHKDPVMREIFQDVRFRQAMSLAINREDISELQFFGQVDPRHATMVEDSRYFEEGFDTAYGYIDYDPERAEKLLDEMGLDEKDSEGYRLRPDGERLNFTVLGWQNHYNSMGPIAEMAAEDWRAIGVDVRIDFVSAELIDQRITGNNADANSWAVGRSNDIQFPVYAWWYVPHMPPGWERTHWVEWERWYTSDGESGEEPPAEIKQLLDWWEDILVEPDQERRIELGKNILRSHAENMWTIGTVSTPPRIHIAGENLRNIPGSNEVYEGYDILNAAGTNPSHRYLVQED